ncbi:hypothetical protein HMPREF0294_0578 [Corynebacterium glucuronolyticum ATCC 51867]|nr:hypothetical protein HMPREF0294_0578 [Corynebacterium glucuronolyticum ATCC 51867]
MARGVELDSNVCSSPQVRGRLKHESQFNGNAGLIPAGAGQIRSLYHPVRQPQAHPRSCGANEHLADGRVLSPGSSPQVRGR